MVRAESSRRKPQLSVSMPEAHVFWQLDGSLRIMVYTLVVAHIGALVRSVRAECASLPAASHVARIAASDILVRQLVQQTSS